MTDRGQCGLCAHGTIARSPTPGKLDFTKRECRRFPPQPMLFQGPGGVQIIMQFPVLERDQWCGEYERGDDQTSQLGVAPSGTA